jgi:hypothetical protein
MLSSCSEDIKPEPFTYSQIFSGKNSKTWKLKSISLIEKGKSDINYSLPNCITDDVYIFYANEERLLEVKEGNSKCSSGDPEVIATDTWSFVNATASLSFVFPLLADIALPYIVKDVNKTNMTLEIYLDEAGTQSYRMKFQSTNEN